MHRFSCENASFSCESCNQPQLPQYSCVSCEQPIDPIFPASSNVRHTIAKKPKCVPNKKQAPIRPHAVKKAQNKIQNESIVSSNKCPNDFRKGSQHPNDCACSECDKSVGAVCPQDNDTTKSTSQDPCPAHKEMAQKNMKNYLIDNPQLTETKYVKTSGCSELNNDLMDPMEVWLLQCPKGFDPKTIMNTEISKLKKGKINLTAKRFADKISLACLAPQKAAEYEAICDNIKMLRPVGKITVISDSKVHISEESSLADECSDAENMDECCDEDTPISSKKVKKKINDHRFTIETTVTVENCGKKGKKHKKETYGECLPLVEPVVPKKKQRKNSCDDDEDTSWLKC